MLFNVVPIVFVISFQTALVSDHYPVKCKLLQKVRSVHWWKNGDIHAFDNTFSDLLYCTAFLLCKVLKLDTN